MGTRSEADSEGPRGRHRDAQSVAVPPALQSLLGLFPEGLDGVDGSALLTQAWKRNQGVCSVFRLLGRRLEPLLGQLGPAV